MITKVISGIKSLRKIFIPKSESVEEPKKVNKVQSTYTGVPAPVVVPDDPWFGSAPKTEKALRYVQTKNEQKQINKTKEPENIHQVMYERATKNSPTTIQLNPPGGSEVFQEGPGGWHSGTGYNQFRN
jgi:hypothetical protein